MRIKFSPLVASASSKAADMVASSWKGRAYIRKHVIPHNPKTPAQTLVRDSLARCVPLWRSLSSTIKTWLDTYGTGYRMSGYNTFMSKNRAAEQASTALAPVPPEPRVLPVVDLAGDVTISSIITVTWTDPVETGFTNMALILRDQAKDVFELEILDTLAAAETYDFDPVTTGLTYDLYGWLYDPIKKIMGSVASHLDLLVT
ncbi:hypothetical protein ES705_29339 [subsurface metagenome]